jgi:hypothetical protein
LLAPVAAWAQAPLRVCVLAPAHGEFAARVRGQTGDLPIVLTFCEGAADPDSLSEAEVASVLQAQSAELGVWLSGAGDGSHAQVHVFDARTGQVRVRSVGGGEGGLKDASARNEIAALLVRGELAQELTEDKAAPVIASAPGADARTSEFRGAQDAVASSPVEEPHASAAPSSPAPTDGASASESAAGPSPWGFSSSLFVQVTVPDAQFLLLGVGGYYALRYRSLEFGLKGSAGVPDSENVHGTKLRLRQDRFVATLAYVRRPSRSLRWGLGVESGAALFWRSTLRTRDDLQATARALAPSFLAAPTFELVWTPRIRWLGVIFRVGVDPLTTPPRYEIETARGPQRIESLWAAQPWLHAEFFGLMR